MYFTEDREQELLNLANEIFTRSEDDVTIKFENESSKLIMAQDAKFDFVGEYNYKDLKDILILFITEMILFVNSASINYHQFMNTVCEMLGVEYTGDIIESIDIIFEDENCIEENYIKMLFSLHLIYETYLMIQGDSNGKIST